MKNKLMWVGLSLALSITFLLCTVAVLTAEEVATTAAVPAATLTVCKDGPPTCDFSVVQTAVDAAATNGIIKVAAGVYTDINSDADLAQVIYISQALTIHGGYTSAFDEPPDPENNPTIIDAQGLGRGIAIITDPDVDVVLAGLQITGGDATDLGGLVLEDIGGGILSLYANLTLSHSMVFSNTDNSEISYASRGGGIFIGGGSAQILETFISGNTGDYGGGLSAYVAHLRLYNSHIVSNEGGAGGGIFLQDTEADIDGNLIQNNLASVNDNLGVGGGIIIFDSSITLTNNFILANVADGMGGGIATVKTDLTMINSIIADNQAVINAGGLYLSGSSGQLFHSTIANNGLLGLVITGSVSFSGLEESHLVLTNTIVAGHGGLGVIAAPDSTAVLYNTLWYDNAIDYAGNVTTTADFTGDPAFIDPNNGNYHITATSAALNLGAVTSVLLDIDGESRLAGTAPDLGADEWPQPLTNVPIEGLMAINDSPTPLNKATLFTATINSGNNVSYLWGFGDGAVDNGANTSHVYTNPGVYTAVVTASNFINLMTATTVVTVTDIAISGLTAVNDSPTPLGNLTTLTATVSSGSDVNYIWDLGDGSQATGTVITHEYGQIGVYTAVVTATNTINTLTATAMVTVTEVAITGLTAVNSGPSELGTATFLTATTTAGTNISYTWDLGDGTVAYGSLISHTYSQTGTYTASVTATNSMSTVTATTVITISETVSVPTFPLYLPFVAKPVSPVALSPSTIQQQPQRGRLLP